MNKEKDLEVLTMLRDYVNENWDEEYRDNMNDVNETSNFLVSVLSSKSNVVGKVVIDGKEYMICEISEQNE